MTYRYSATTHKYGKCLEFTKNLLTKNIIYLDVGNHDASRTSTFHWTYDYLA